MRLVCVVGYGLLVALFVILLLAFIAVGAQGVMEQHRQLLELSK